MRLSLIVLLCAVALVRAYAADVLVKQITLAVVPQGAVRFRECKYYVDDDRAAKIPRINPENPDTYLPPAKALAIAFDRHFTSGILKARYYREVQISLEKADDYSESAVAKAVRSSAACGNLWFYVVSCGRSKFGETELGPAPILVLMDGSIVTPKEELKSPR